MGKTLPDFSVACSIEDSYLANPEMKQHQTHFLKELIHCGVPIQKIVSTNRLYDWIISYPSITIYYFKAEPSAIDSFLFYIPRENKIQDYYELIDEFNPIEVLVHALKQKNRSRAVLQQIQTSLESVIEVDMNNKQLWIRNVRIDDTMPKSLQNKFKTLKKNVCKMDKQPQINKM